ncbi:MAG: 5-formyltetrahydrofolate cyclo-ligase [Armatimonadota bacterium]|nr:5-formyltetrahydrofolate cyclo-ligase [Armatimonadota bacterium]MDR7413529.1 5-formyltetrahydrofolate cyclo-ligase [Armatimonadota bacterium]MDR7430631.1 5-formyltetrahydrofolate cyclo-ligase [Armatimonadota bacterium]MDR7447161.1 5-formyltetrahydrofolate cyclo-ligase [Armatimonadota bacterium]MDR7525921.1 5-formyltetrahydrofolate cyclo-ligase [Armatimonadota bacterium]
MRGRTGRSHEAATTEVEQAKQAVRERVWRLLADRGVARFPGAWGRIPNFQGAEEAAQRLASTEEWRRARVVKANPDRPQLPVRTRALAEGKLLYVAVPRLAKPEPFVCVDPARLRSRPRDAASIRGAFRHGRPVGLAEMVRVDLVVCGSVAVNRQGARVGKGGGYSDLEFGLLREFGLVDDETVVATTVHPLQILTDDLPETEHDFRVDLIVTPEEVLRTPAGPRPPGILVGHLTARKVEAIPVLRDLLRRTAGGKFPQLS